MKDQTKEILGRLVIKLGEHAVGKCMVPGMYDPPIPQALKEEMRSKNKC